MKTATEAAEATKKSKSEEAQGDNKPGANRILKKKLQKKKKKATAKKRASRK